MEAKLNLKKRALSKSSGIFPFFPEELSFFPRLAWGILGHVTYFLIKLVC